MLYHFIYGRDALKQWELGDRHMWILYTILFTFVHVKFFYKTFKIKTAVQISKVWNSGGQQDWWEQQGGSSTKTVSEDGIK